jgi:hypothetical protein
MHEQADTFVRSEPFFERAPERLGCICNGIKLRGKTVLISITAVLLKMTAFTAGRSPLVLQRSPSFAAQLADLVRKRNNYKCKIGFACGQSLKRLIGFFDFAANLKIKLMIGCHLPSAKIDCVSVAVMLICFC